MPHLRCICTPLRKRLRWFPETKDRPPTLVSRTRRSASSAVRRGAGTHSWQTGWAPDQQRTTHHAASAARCAASGARQSQAEYSLLALRTPEGRASVLGEPLDDAAAAVCLAFLAFAVINLDRVLEIAEFAGGLAMVAQRRAAGLDRLIQHRVNGIDQAFGVIGRFSFFCRQGRGQSSRRQMRTKQRLTDIDVAEARDHALIEQRRLQAGLLAGTGARQHGGVEFIAERFGAETA